MAADPSFLPLAELVQDVFRLRYILRQSKMDGDLRDRKNGVAIYYLLDPDVLELYTSPALWADDLRALPSLTNSKQRQNAPTAGSTTAKIPTDEELLRNATDQEVMRATALLTGEYVFGERLVEGFSGDQECLYAAPEHVLELVGHAARIEARFERAAEKLPPTSSPIYGRLRHLFAIRRHLFDAGELSAQQLVEQTRNALVHSLVDISHESLIAPYRLAQLLEGARIGNAASKADFVPTILAPTPKSFGWWRDTIRGYKSSGHNSDEAIEADAITMAQLTMLNEDWLEKKRVFVLITRDQSLEVAFRAWRTLNSDNARSFYPLRHPRQYVPILNIHDMGGHYRARDIFREIDNAVEGIAATFSSFDQIDDHADSTALIVPGRREIIDQLRAASRANPSRVAEIAHGLREKMDNISRLWISANAYAAAAKADVIEEWALAENEYYRHLFERKMLPHSFSTQIVELSSRFEELQTGSTLVRHEIASVRAAANRTAQGVAESNEHNRRDLPSEFTDFRSRPFLGQNLSDIVHTLPRKPNAIEVLASAKHRNERLLVAAGISLDIGSWDGAENLLRRARGHRRQNATTPLGRELEFFHCMARRLASTPLNWNDWSFDIEEDLLRLLETSPTPLERTRASSELAALILCRASWSLDPKKLDAEIVHYLRRADRQLEQTKRLLHRYAPAHLDALGWQSVQKQYALNTLDLAFWMWATKTKLSAPTRARIESALAFSEKLEEQGKPGLHRTLYPPLARLALADNHGVVRDLAVNILDEIANLMLRDREDGIAFDMPATDRVEFTKVSDVLALMLTQGDD